MKLCIKKDLSVTLKEGNCFKIVEVELQGERMVWKDEQSEFIIHTLSKSLLGDKRD